MPTALIVDDEELARCLIREYLGSHTDIAIVGECENGLQAVEAIDRFNPDLIFLDIQMPKLTGLEVLAASGPRCGVIFTTAYDDYALKAFDLHAVDYLLKPFTQARFDDALTQARAQLGRAPHTTKQLVAQARLERILIRDRGLAHVIAVSSVDYVEAQDDYICLHAQGKSWMKTQSLSTLAAQLDARQFVRVHRSYLVNIDSVQKIERVGKDGHVAVLRNGQQIPISRTGHERLKAAL